MKGENHGPKSEREMVRFARTPNENRQQDG